MKVKRRFGDIHVGEIFEHTGFKMIRVQEYEKRGCRCAKVNAISHNSLCELDEEYLDSDDEVMIEDPTMDYFENIPRSEWSK